jgi:hypothetical protein
MGTPSPPTLQLEGKDNFDGIKILTSVTGFKKKNFAKPFSE